ncbi:hypothetical protein MMC30_005502 [Trapelia coarctata]|nr:hypothetical protein [Trapelia coarctata]
MSIYENGGRDFNDIIKYVKSEAKRIAEELLSRQPAELDFVAKDLITRSKGVFLWVKLVLAELEERAMASVSSLAEIEAVLRSIPSDLEELYERIIIRLNEKGEAVIREYQLVFRWVAFAPEPLNLEELDKVLATSRCGSSGVTQLDLKRNRVGSAEDMSRRLKSRCGNLVEVSEADDELAVVQFIHQTVLEFLMQREKHPLVLLPEETSRVEIITLRTRYIDFLAATVQEWELPANGDDLTSLQMEQFAALFQNAALLPHCLQAYFYDRADVTHETRTKMNTAVRLYVQRMDSLVEILSSILPDYDFSDGIRK